MSDSDLPLGQEFELEPTTATSSNTNTDEAEEESSDMEMGVMDNSPREERTSITGSAEPRISEESSRSSEDGEDVEEAGKPNYNNLNRVTEMATKTPLRVFGFFVLTIHSLGVVYGDIGTSPLYVFSTVFGSVDFGRDEVLGAMSMIAYSLIFVVFIKYIIIVLSAGRDREGGVLVLASLIPPDPFKAPKTKEGTEQEHKEPAAWTVYLRGFCVFLSFCGVGLLLGDGAITPAISVLSAIEGVITQYSNFSSAEVPVGCFIIFLLFMAQRFGTAKVGTIFGPIMLLWFIANGIIGIFNIMNHPECMLAWNPSYINAFFTTYGGQAWTLLGSVVLAITGVEALYADMGHFGPWPIRTSWTFIVFPSLLLTYFGQAGALIDDPSIVSNVYYLSIPNSVFWPMFVLAVAAALIASQAMISGTFSLLYQANIFDYFPALSVVHTSKSYIGQVYVPVANYCLMIVTIALILFFQDSASLAAAYGVCVTGVLCITTILFVLMLCRRWPWSTFVAVPIGALFFIVDISYFSANLIKFTDGGWVPLLIAAIILVLFCSWALGRMDVRAFYRKDKRHLTPEDLLEWVKNGSTIRTPDTVGVFLLQEGVIPKALNTYHKVTGSLPKTLILLQLKVTETPKISKGDMLEARDLGDGVLVLSVQIGFKNKRLNAIRMLRKAVNKGILPPAVVEATRTTFFLPKETLVSKFKRRFWTAWRLGIYNFLVSHSVISHIHFPPSTVIEIGSRITIKEVFSSRIGWQDNFICRFFQK